MYSYISGTLEEVREDSIVVDNHGIGYLLYIPLRIHEELPEIGSQVKMFTYLQVREDTFVLFGFASEDEIAMFRLLLNVSGIGPKGALALLSSYSANEIRFAVASDDDKLLSRASGIGSKTAQRIIIELKDKVDLEEAVDALGSTGPVVYEGNSAVKKDAVEALVALGYTSSDAARVLSCIEISEKDEVEEVLKQALKNMAMI